MELGDVYESIREDSRWDHLRTKGTVLVKGRGQTDKPLAMVVGEAPGAIENTAQRPFCGPSGRVLRDLMGLAGLYVEDRPPWGNAGDGDSGMESGTLANAFITYVVKYRPEGGRTPNIREILIGVEALQQEWIAIGRPRLIVAVGPVARTALVPVERVTPPGDWVGLPDGKTFVWSQYSPAWGLRQGDKAKETMERQWEEMGQWILLNGNNFSGN